MKRLAVALLKIKNTDKYILQRRAEDVKISPGLLGFFGGHIEGDESSLDAIVREMSEETSLDLKRVDLKLVKHGIYDIPSIGQKLEVNLYEAEVGSDNFEVYEGERSETYSIQELKKRSDLSPMTLEAILSLK